MAWNRSPDDSPASSPPPSRPTGSKDPRVSTLGPSISIQGDLEGAEDLRIEGSIEGTVRLDNHRVVVASSGRIKADIHSRSICVEGEVKGNLNGEEEVIIRPSGKLEGNITAPSVTLENGAKFRGSIDMEPSSRRPEATPAPAPSKPAEEPKADRSGPLPTPAAAKG